MSFQVSNLEVEGMSCIHCKENIQESIKPIDGVNSVTVDLKTKTICVEYNPDKVKLHTIVNNLENMGYTIMTKVDIPWYYEI